MLKRIKGDCTFNQGAFHKLTEGWSHFSSVDLTAATDIIPIQLQRW
jgi:hypothetical protein